MGGKGGPREFAENALGIVLANAAMRPFMGLFKNPGAVSPGGPHVGAVRQTDGQVRGACHRGDRRRDRGGPCCAFAATHFDQLKAATSDEFILQGISLVASKFVERASISDAYADQRRSGGERQG